MRNVKFSSVISINRLSLIASLPRNDYALAKAAWESGADAVKVHVNLTHRAGGHSFGTLSEEKELGRIIADCPVSMGIVAGTDPDSAEADLAGIEEMGFSFVSMYIHQAPAALLLSRKVERMLAVDYTYDEADVLTLRAVGADILEASIVRPELYRTRLDMRDILNYAKLVKSSSLPVVVPTQKDIRPYECEALKAVGVRCVMIGTVVAGDTPQSFSAALEEFGRYR